MPYAAITAKLDDLVAHGFSHVQVPPVQPHRTLDRGDEAILKKKYGGVFNDVQEFLKKYSEALEHNPNEVPFFLTQQLKVHLPVIQAVIKAHIAAKKFVIPYQKDIVNGVVNWGTTGPKQLAAMLLIMPNQDVGAFKTQWETEFFDPATQPWWTIYQPTEFKLGDTRFGTKAEFLSLVAAAKQKGLFVIVDVVLNHLTGKLGEWKDWNDYLDRCLKGLGNPAPDQDPRVKKSHNIADEQHVKDETNDAETLELLFPDTIADCAAVNNDRRLRTAQMGEQEKKLVRGDIALQTGLTAIVKEATGIDDLSQIQTPFYCGNVGARKELPNKYGAPVGQQCWLAQANPQVIQTHPNIQKIEREFLQELRTGGVGGIRVDAAGHMTPTTCIRLADFFFGKRLTPDEMTSQRGTYSYFEVLGGAGRLFVYDNDQYDRIVPSIDVSLGGTLMEKVFKYGGDINLLTFFPRESRRRNDGSAMCIFTHDTLNGALDNNFLTRGVTDYDLAMCYILQRPVGVPLLQEMDLERPMIMSALKFRKTYMEGFSTPKEFNSIVDSVFVSKKSDREEGGWKSVTWINVTSETKYITIERGVGNGEGHQITALPRSFGYYIPPGMANRGQFGGRRRTYRKR
jgi:hypothetical protein